MKTTNKYLPLLCLCAGTPFFLLLLSIIITFLFSIHDYMIYKDFKLNYYLIHRGYKISKVGVFVGVGLWYILCRQNYIPIFGNSKKFRALVLSCIVLPVYIFFMLVFYSSVISLLAYFFNGYFQLDFEELTLNYEVSRFGAFYGAYFFYLEWRRYGIPSNYW